MTIYKRIHKVDKWYCWNCGYSTVALSMHASYADSIDANCPECKKLMMRQSPEHGEKVKEIKTKRGRI